MPERKSQPTVLVIGGGINGIGVFRELVLQGIDVLLVERGDFASGATAASSHMVHGGIRYLENGELRLVRESVVERNRLLRVAPHRVTPLETTIPIFSTFSGLFTAPLRLLTHRAPARPRERGALLIKIGLVIYDTFSRDGGTVPRHRIHGRRRSLGELPQLNPNVRYTATYYDASMDQPERLALDVLGDALAVGPHARALNYTEAVGMDEAGVRLRDLDSGREWHVTPDVIINASGPWTDLTNEALGEPTSYLGGTKGSHVVLDDPELLAATGGREIFFENNDGRIVLIYPLNGRVLVGTTDLEADPREPVECTDSEVDYFADLVRTVFPDLELRRDRIVYSFSGIRPLPHHADLAPGLVSRDYRIEVSRDGRLGIPTVSLIGGKWTTFRAVAEHLGDTVLTLLSTRRRQSTTNLPIGGGAGFPAAANRVSWRERELPGVAVGRADLLLSRYGTRAALVLPYLADDQPLLGDELSTGELRFLVEHEWVKHLDDVVFRRTTLAFRGLLAPADVERIGAALASIMGWDDGSRRAEVDATVEKLRIAQRPSGIPAN
ncbi:MAG: glycerol-3-phosphate dehydrogenase/oxidase [Pseudolysinimonas sp.]|uniref:glycerol-3-phosphate dehydrogenase/oxidase n=1 Tax=Pseudolysinimonas sp. TaxID=2680009 RepID=UPI0032631EAD